MPTAKTPLAEHLREALTDRFESVPQASAMVGIPYERLKKAIRENRFNAADLAILMPGWAAADLEAEYDFQYSRRHAGTEAKRLLTALPNVQLFNQVFTPFLKKAVADTEFQDFVNNVYRNLTRGTSMFLFCSKTFLPLEWDLKGKEVLEKICGTIAAGGAVIYVFEDEIGDEFELFTKALDRLRPGGGGGGEGFVALLKVPSCTFCTPYQKLALLTLWEDDGAMIQQALTAMEVSASVGSPDKLGMLVLPLVSEVESNMRKYLNRLVNSMEDGTLPDGFAVDCYPKMEDSQFVQRLREIV